MHLCFSKENYSVGRETTQALVTRKYDYSIQNCHLICFSIQSVPHPEILHPSNEKMRSIYIYCICTGYIIYLLWLLWALTWPTKSLNRRALTTRKFKASHRSLLMRHGEPLFYLCLPCVTQTLVTGLLQQHGWLRLVLCGAKATLPIEWEHFIAFLARC